MIKEVEGLTNLTKFIMWSDGCAAQFRSRFVFKLLANYCRDLQLECNYNDDHDGKGPMDGIGETIKNVVFRQLKSGRDFINSSQQICAVNSKAISKTKTFGLRAR